MARLGTLTRGKLPVRLRGRDGGGAAESRAGRTAIAVGIPADTLRRRPDVRSAERQLAAATARIGVAKAALFPALSISGNINTDAASIGNLGSLLTGGLFAGTHPRDIRRRASASRRCGRPARGADLAFANYKQTVLSGLEDVENAVQSLEAAKARQAAARDRASTLRTTRRSMRAANIARGSSIS